ncbi:sugar ABC transporter substrate-binding protein [Subtercola sp. YIM 133946]|uniref:sugar ABC transporter substrate-binding protein n=1 Tax=Subtercola sp. YIM 133946 TaxID=3118909 RepID=UPI002F923B1E
MSAQHRRLGATAIATAVVSVALLAGCSSSPGGTAASASGGAGGGTSQVTTAMIDALRQGTPGTSTIPDLPGASTLAGKTIMYIPIVQASPSFTPTIAGLKDAAAKLGVNLVICDGGANPSQISSCLTQASQQKLAAVITDSISPVLAGQGFAALQAAGVPLVLGDEDNIEPTATQASVGGAFAIEFTKQAAQYAIWDSNGAADALLVQVTDDPVTTSSFEKGTLATFTSQCPGCTTTVIQTTTGQLAQLPAAVSSAMIKDPDINYVIGEFDSDVPGIIQALSTSNSRSVKVIGAVGVLQSLQAIKANQFVVADAGVSGYEEGWQMVDQAARLALGVAAIPDYQPSSRLFDATNVGDLNLTAEGASDGSWFGDDSFKTRIVKAWGMQ